MRFAATCAVSAGLATAWPLGADATSFTVRLEALEIVYAVDPGHNPARVSQSFEISPPIADPISLSLDLTGHVTYPIFEDSLGALVDYPFVVHLRMSGAEWEAGDPGGSNAGGLFPPYSARETEDDQSAFELALEPDGSFRYSTIFIFSGLEFSSLSLVTAGIAFEALCGNYVLLPCPQGTTPPYTLVESGSVSISYAGITFSDSVLSPDLSRALVVPEPGGSLLLLGLCGLAFRARHSRTLRASQRASSVSVGGDAKVRDLLALLGGTDLGSAPEIADRATPRTYEASSGWKDGCLNARCRCGERGKPS